MSKAVMLSIRPKWCEKIASGEKTVEVRRKRPKLKTPFKCYVYETQGWVERDGIMEFALGGRVICEFTCDRIDRLARVGFGGSGEPAKYYICNSDMSVLPLVGICEDACLTKEELEKYIGGHEGFGWHISDLKIYDTPKKLSEFTGLRDTRSGAAPYEINCPPQSWYYVQEME